VIPRLLLGTNGLLHGVGCGKPRRRASSSQDLDHDVGRRRPVFRLRPAAGYANRPCICKSRDATGPPLGAQRDGHSGGRGWPPEATFARRCDTMMTLAAARKGLSTLVFSPPIRFLSQGLPETSRIVGSNADAPVPFFPADPARHAKGGGNRLAPADAARRHGPPGGRRHLRLPAARDARAPQGGPDRT